MKYAKRLRTPLTFLILAIGAAVLAPISPTVAIVVSVSVIFLCFPLKFAIIFVVLYLAFSYTHAHTAFVLDREYSKTAVTLITTKGRHKDIPNAKEGDILWGKFPYELSAKSTLPRKIFRTEGTYRVLRIFPISHLLEARIRNAAHLYNNSGGIITTTPAHIYAIRGYIPQKLRDEFIITGLAHLLAMSGFHVGIFLAGFFLFLPFLPKKVRAIPAIILLPLLIPLSGFAVTVVRAVFFSMVFLISWCADLKVRSLNFLALLAGIILLLSPFSLYSISFLLSFGAVFGIIVLVNKDYDPITTIIAMGLASNVFTLPLQLYFFGTSNVLSVLTTVVMTPLVWVQMLMGLAAIVIPSVMIPPLSVIEQVIAWLMEIMTRVSWYALYVAKPPTAILAVSSVLAMGLCFTKYRLISLLIMFMPLLPIYERNVVIFPDLPASQKGYVISSPQGNEIFFQGTYSSFVYNMLPQVARLGIREFDKGKITIFNGENYYLRIKEPESFIGVVCVNEQEGCPYHFSTRSNSLKHPLPESVLKFIIYKNSPIDERILLQSELGDIRLPLPQ